MPFTLEITQLSGIPKTLLRFDPSLVRPQWFHPFLLRNYDGTKLLSRQELHGFAYDYFLRLLTFFRHQPDGDLAAGVMIEFSAKMRHKLGQAELFSHTIRLNQVYFQKDPRLLPYSLFHELVHMWLYDCLFDPGHTRRFYMKMNEFSATGLPEDPDVHIHKRIANDARYVYVCTACKNRWFVNVIDPKDRLYCGFCYEQNKATHYPRYVTNQRDELRPLLLGP